MLGSDRIHIALALATAAFLGCGGSETTSGKGGNAGSGGSQTTTWTGGGTGGTTETTTSSGGEGGSLTCDNNEGTVLAVSELGFGEGNSGEWKSVGFNLDGKDSDGNSKDVCKPNSGGDPDTAYPDGDNGIDNSFGKNLLPILISLYPNWVDEVNNGITDGVFTSLLRMDCLPPTGDVPKFTSKLFGATMLGYTPHWDGTDMWPVAPELLSDNNDPQSSTVLFEHSSVKGTLFDTGPGNTFILTVPLNTQNGNTSIKLTLYAARTAMTLAVDRKSATAGTIGGVLNTEELVTEIKKVGKLMNLCDTDVFNGIITQVRQASDMLSDGTQDPNKTCDGISLGLAFKMSEALIGGVGPAATIGASCN